MKRHITFPSLYIDNNRDQVDAFDLIFFGVIWLVVGIALGAFFMLLFNLLSPDQFGEGRRLGGLSSFSASCVPSETALSSNISPSEKGIVTVGCGFGLSQPTRNFKAGRPSGQIGFICRFSAARYRDLLPYLETSTAQLTTSSVVKSGNSSSKGHRTRREDDACNVGGHDRDFIQRVTAGRDQHPISLVRCSGCVPGLNAIALNTLA